VGLFLDHEVKTKNKSRCNKSYNYQRIQKRLWHKIRTSKTSPKNVVLKMKIFSVYNESKKKKCSN